MKDSIIVIPPKSWRHDPHGRLIHDGDCWYWDLRLCTCGLLHHLRPMSPEITHTQVPHFFDQIAMNDSQIERLRDLGPPPLEKCPTPAESKARMKRLRALLAEHGLRLGRKGP